MSLQFAVPLAIIGVAILVWWIRKERNKTEADKWADEIREPYNEYTGQEIDEQKYLGEDIFDFTQIERPHYN